MDFLKAELERKRKANEELKKLAAANGANFNSKKKFVRRGDILKAQELQKREKEKQWLEQRRGKKTNEVVPTDDGISNPVKKRSIYSIKRVKKGGDSAAQIEHGDEERENEDEGEKKMSPSEVKKKLRARGKPITLFGETDSERLQRWKEIEKTEEDDDAEDQKNKEFQLGAGFDIQNTFLGREGDALKTPHTKDDDEGFDDEDGPRRRKGKARPGGGAGLAAVVAQAGAAEDGGDSSGGEEGGEGTESGAGVGAAGGGGEGPAKPMSDHKRIYKYFKTLMRQWEEDLNARDDSVKRTAQGKLETKTQKQCKDYIRPLFKLCKARRVPPEILPNLIGIVDFCEQGEFVKAHDLYILTAIGNQAWPMGLTSVGIHERSGRERIQTKNVAHVMNNESQRKYLTSVKRLMVYNQSKRPDVPPSKKVLNK